LIISWFGFSSGFDQFGIISRYFVVDKINQSLCVFSCAPASSGVLWITTVRIR
jgi:hypothetical protein